MSDLTPIRVVYWPGNPLDAGVECNDPRRYVVIWNDGHTDHLDDEDRLEAAVHPDPDDRGLGLKVEVMQVSDDELRRAFEWCLAAVRAPEPVCACCWEARRD